jgi:hypothetical protein
MSYLRLLKNPEVKFRFDIVEVLMRQGAVSEIRHIPSLLTFLNRLIVLINRRGLLQQ